VKGAAIVAVMLTGGVARAGGYAIPETAATAGGTAGASTARSGDASAAWYDPAALVDGAGWRLGVGVMLPLATLSATAPDGSWRTDTQGQPLPVPQLFASRAWGDLAVGLAVTVPYGGDVAWPADWPGRHEIVSTQMMDVRLAPFVGWRHGAVRIAGGVHVDFGQLTIAKQLDFVDTDGDVHMQLHGTGVGADASAFVQATDEVDVGLSYKSRTHVPLSGQANFTAPDAFSMKTPDQQVSSALELPDRIAVGASWRRGAFRALGDLEVVVWSVNRTQVIDFSMAQTPDVTQVNDWHTTLAARAGGEWTHGRFVGRAGLAYDPSPASAEHLGPIAPDGDRVEATLGASWQLGGGTSLDAFYGYLHVGARASTNPDSTMATYGGSANLLGLGVRVDR
jgi:long-chain fatty acid transport protein